MNARSVVGVAATVALVLAGSRPGHAQPAARARARVIELAIRSSPSARSTAAEAAQGLLQDAPGGDASLGLEPEFPVRGRSVASCGRLMPFPFADLPGSEATIKSRFRRQGGGDRAPAVADQESTPLVENFKAGDKEKILAESDVARGSSWTSTRRSISRQLRRAKTGKRTAVWAACRRSSPARAKELKSSPDAANYLEQPEGVRVSPMMLARTSGSTTCST